jgi:hypothetical protein
MSETLLHIVDSIKSQWPHLISLRIGLMLPLYLCPYLPNGLFPSSLYQEILYALLRSPTMHHVLPNSSSTLIIMREAYQL